MVLEIILNLSSSPPLKFLKIPLQKEIPTKGPKILEPSA